MNMLQRYIKTAIDISTLAEYIDKTAAVITGWAILLIAHVPVLYVLQ